MYSLDRLAAALLALGAAAVWAGYRFVVTRTNKRTLPPGPRQRWLIGNLLDIPTEYPWRKYADWAETYGADSLRDGL